MYKTGRTRCACEEQKSLEGRESPDAREGEDSWRGQSWTLLSLQQEVKRWMRIQRQFNVKNTEVEQAWIQVAPAPAT